MFEESAYDGRVLASNQHYKSKSCGDFLKLLSRELKLEGNVYDITEALMKLKEQSFKKY